jgi:hypothetical protein
MHSRKDVNFMVTRALPAQNTAENSSSLDLEIAAPQFAGEYSEVEVVIPETTTATGQTITVTLQDSADNSSFAQIPECETLVLTGVSNATARTNRKWRLPRGVKRYVNIRIAMSATTGNQTAITASLSLLL